MKFIVKIMMGLILFCLASCVKDNSIVGSTPLDAIKVSGIDPNYSKAIDDILNINPTIDKQFLKDTDLDYVWYAYTQATQFKPDTLGKTKDLAYKVKLTPGVTYTVILKVTDRTTGVFYKSNTTLAVGNDFSPGLLILTQNNGKAELSFLNTVSNKFIEDAYFKVNNESLGINPISVGYYPKSGNLPSEVVLLCEDARGGVICNATDLTFNRTILNTFVTSYPFTGTMFTQKYVNKSTSGLQDYLVINGKIHNRQVNSSEILFRSEMIGQDYTISPVVFYEGTNTRPSFFDVKNKRFLVQSGTNGVLSTLPSGTTSSIIDPNNVGLLPLHGGQVSGNNAFGIFENPEKTKRFILRFLCNAQAGSFTATEKFEVSTVTDMMNATSFTSTRSLASYLFYSAGSKVYVYNAVSKSGSLLLDLGSTNAIDNIKIELGTMELKVGYTNNSLAGKKGSFATYTLSTIGGVTATKVLQKEGFCDKVIDITTKI
ncbi:PKD-like family lipoprotein [Pedobacter sp. MW01-1-1]|uniref:PKD-like family lipoprotein n=1 Tax=Pedobacter sp. MW01-1-1 TaxID=3383027 RepID=UPI003FF0C7D5